MPSFFGRTARVTTGWCCVLGAGGGGGVGPAASIWVVRPSTTSRSRVGLPGRASTSSTRTSPARRDQRDDRVRDDRGDRRRVQERHRAGGGEPRLDRRGRLGQRPVRHDDRAAEQPDVCGRHDRLLDGAVQRGRHRACPTTASTSSGRLAAGGRRRAEREFGGKLVDVQNPPPRPCRTTPTRSAWWSLVVLLLSRSARRSRAAPDRQRDHRLAASTNVIMTEPPN